MTAVAVTILAQCLALKRGERLVVVTDGRYDSGIPEAILTAATAAGAEARLETIPGAASGAEIQPDVVLSRIAGADAIVLCTAFLFSGSARDQIAARGGRVLSLSGISRATYLRACAVDHEAVSRVTLCAAASLAGARQARIVTSAGTDIRLELAALPPVTLSGLARWPRNIAVLPAGVVASIPESGTASGRLVVDGSIDGLGVCMTPVVLVVDGGEVMEITGGREAHDLRQRLADGDDASLLVSEVGFGTNPKAAYCGNILEDERVAGSCHVGLGRNRHLGGSIESVTHLDLTVRHPTLWIDGQVIIRDGQLDVRAAVER